VLFLQDAVGINREGVGNRGHPKHFCNWACESAIAVLRLAHFVFGDIGLPFLFIVIQADAHFHSKGSNQNANGHAFQLA
jgi:hypothetical protein